MVSPALLKSIIDERVAEIEMKIKEYLDQQIAAYQRENAELRRLLGLTDIQSN